MRREIKHKRIGKCPSMARISRKAVQECDTQERYSVEEAVEKSLGASFAKFDESVDIALRLGVDPKYSDQMVRGAVTLPNGPAAKQCASPFSPRAKSRPKPGLPAPISW